MGVLSLESYWDLFLGICVVFSSAFTVFLLTLPSQYSAFQPGPAEREAGDRNASTYRTGERTSKVETTVQVLVLGDIGRSPRMQYHAISIAKHGGRVQVIGYAGGRIASCRI